MASLSCPSCCNGINGEFDPVTGNFLFSDLDSVGVEEHSQHAPSVTSFVHMYSQFSVQQSSVELNGQANILISCSQWKWSLQSAATTCGATVAKLREHVQYLWSTVKGIRQMINRQVVTKREAVVQKRASVKELNTSCSKHTVIVNKEWLNDNMIPKNIVIDFPPSIHVDVCGGNCDRTVPEGPLHATMFHLLATSSNNREAALESPDQYSRCCVPMEYAHATFFMREGRSWKMETVQNITVTKCGCIYYKKYQTAWPLPNIPWPDPTWNLYCK